MPDQLIVLGSSSGVPTRRRFAPGYALTAAGKLFLIDCGAPVSTLLYRYDLDPLDVQAVLLSHWHMDHVANLGLFLTQNHLRQRLGKLTVYGPHGTRGKIARLLEDSFVDSDNLNYKLKVKNVSFNKKYKEALLRVRFFKTQHLEKSSLKTEYGRKAVASGMVINGPGWRIVYSGDTRSPDELAPYIKGCTLLIHEMAHHPPEEVAKFATLAEVPNVLISHIGPDYDESPELIEAAFKAQGYEGHLTVAEDGTRLALDGVD